MVPLDHHGPGDALLLQQMTLAPWNLWDHPSQHNISVAFVFTDKGPCIMKVTACFFSLAHGCQNLHQGKKRCSGHQSKVCSPPWWFAVLEVFHIYRATPSLTCYPLFVQQLVLPCLLLPVILTFSFHLNNVTALR